MNQLLTPDAWRSEAFAEDLFEDSCLLMPSPSPWRAALPYTLLGLTPVLLAAASAALVVWGGAA
jgi:hypothetical protein